MQIVDDNTQENDVEFVEEHREMLSPRMVPSPAIVDISKKGTKFEKELPMTPQKRQQPCRVETPTKKRRLSFENAAPVDVSVPLENMPMPDTQLYTEDTLVLIPTDPLPAKETGISISLQHADMELEPIQTSSDISMIKKKTKMHIDKRTTLDTKAFKRRLQNVNIGCRKFVIKPQIHGIQIRGSVTDLFNRPSKGCGTTLLSQFSKFTRHNNGRFTTTDGNIMPVRRTHSEEVVRGLQKTVDEYPEQTSNLLEHIKQAPATESSAIKIQNVCIPEDTSYQEIKMDTDNSEETLEDIEDLLKSKQVPSTSEHQILESSVCSKPEPQTPDWSSTDILAMLEVLWHDRPVVRFSDLISTETYTKEDAITVFWILLDLHSKKKVVLNQAKFCSTLWIQKYETYDD